MERNFVDATPAEEEGAACTVPFRAGGKGTTTQQLLEKVRSGGLCDQKHDALITASIIRINESWDLLAQSVFTPYRLM